MQRNLLTRFPNLLSRVDKINEKVFLKKNQVLEKITFQSLFRSPNGFKQLSLRSRSEVVFLDLHRVLQLSPFLSKLVSELRECCSNPHDQVDICLDQFSPDLLNIIKNILERGECTIRSESEKEQLEDLIQAMGMDENLQLLNCPIDKSLVTPSRKEGETETSFADVAFSDAGKDVLENEINVADETIQTETLKNSRAESGKENKIRESSKANNRKRKSTCEKAKWVVKQRRCINSNNNINSDTGNGQNEDRKGGGSLGSQNESPSGIESNQEGELKTDQFIETLGRKSTRKHFNLFKNYEEVDDSLSEDEDDQEPNWADDCPLNTQTDENNKTEDNLDVTIDEGDVKDKMCLFCGKTYIKSFYLEQHKQTCTKRNYEEEPSNKRERKKCPSCGKMLFEKGIGSKYDQHVSKCLKTLLSSTDQSDSVVKEKKDCPYCGKVYLFKGNGLNYNKHVSKCQNEMFHSENDISSLSEENKAESPISASECLRCGKRFKLGGKGNGRYFLKHIEKCQVEHFDEHKIDNSEEIEEIPCPNACGKRFLDTGALKTHSENCHIREDYIKNTPCQICEYGDFNEKDLMEHLYRKHKDLRSQIQKSFADNYNFSNSVSYYTLEKLKKYCKCPICGKEMKATRNTVGLHWAVDHRKIKTPYNAEIQFNSILKESKSQRKGRSLKSEENLSSSIVDPDSTVQLNSSNEFEVNSLKDACLLIASLKEPENNNEKVENMTNNRKEDDGINNDEEQDNTIELTIDIDYEKKKEKTMEVDDEKEEDIITKINHENLNEGGKNDGLEGTQKFPNLCISNIRTVDELRSRIASTQQKSKALKEKRFKEQFLLSKQPSSSASSENVNEDRRNACSMDIIVDNLKDMDALGTSILRREASKHRVENSSRKPKLEVVEELWEHYLKLHTTNIKFEIKETPHQAGVEVRNEESVSIREQIFGQFTSDTDTD